MKAARTLAKVAPSASSRRLVGSMLPITRRAVFGRANTPIAAQRTRRQLSSGGPIQSTPTAAHKTMSPFILEIERKFEPTAHSMQQLASNTGTPPFESLIHYGTTRLEDAYYDTSDEILCKAGVWLRRRGSKWEVKVRVGGDFTNSAFEEITNVDDISTMLGKLVPGTALDPHDGLTGGRVEEVAKFISERKNFLVDGKFTVVLDETDFGHVVGEVELERNIPATGGEEDVSEAKKVEDHDRAKMMADLDREIDDFMKRYVWAFPPGNPVGKLSAYYALKKGH
ncbi:Thiamine-triphosphatase [Cytospora mali]|uniref:Thiamine-triphosphatase n=1 Tax=Cytospora mali TaxID=578113 RepID=A0A194V5Q5_CYTMA|nr:Thiamine-triphosphatase [Valsa mali var. pyri (nom. inval.)]